MLSDGGGLVHEYLFHLENASHLNNHDGFILYGLSVYLNIPSKLGSKRLLAKSGTAITVYYVRSLTKTPSS